MRKRLQARAALVVCGLGLAAASSCGQPLAPATVSPSPAAVHAPTPAPAPSHEHARELLRALAGEAALAEFGELLRANHHDALAGLSLAQTAIEFGLEAQAHEALSEVIDSDAIHSPAARLGLSLLAYSRYEAEADERDIETAEQQLQSILAVEPKQAHALALAVLLYLLRAERHHDQHAPQSRAICEAHDPVHADLATSCAEEAWRRGDPGRARDLFAQATQTDPEHHGAWLRWGSLELGAGNLRSAQQYLEHATRSPWPSLRISAHATLGVVHDRLGDTPDAIAAYRAARELSERMHRPAPSELMFNLALAASRVADSEAELAEAQGLLEQVLASATPTEPQRLRVQRALAELESIRAEHQRAQR